MKDSMNSIMRVVGFLTGSVFNIVITIIMIILIISFTRKSYAMGAQFGDSSTAGTPHAVTITIPEGADAMATAEILEENGLVNNKYYFWLEARFNGTYDLFLPGTYELNTGIKSADLMEVLQHPPQTPTANENRVTIREGYTLSQMAEYLDNKGLFTAKDFLDACNNDEFNYYFLDSVRDRSNYLEGYLFPDTYFLSDAPTPDELIKKMLDQFNLIFNTQRLSRAEEQGLSLDDTVIIASIIEREVRAPEERAKVSAVIRNRLALGMRLEVDATVMYALNKPLSRLTYADLEIDSPYNTYKRAGLPKGPISAPGEACIDAALNPTGDNYLYYVLVNADTGEHYFTDNYDDFLRVKAGAKN